LTKFIPTLKIYTGQKYLWTNGAPILKKDKAGKLVSDSIFWCSSNETTQKSVIIPTKYEEDSCLAFVKTTGGFEVKNCAQKLHFFCEASIGLITNK